MKDPMMIALIVLLASITLVVGLITYLYWFFPTTYARNYNWGRQVCVEVKAMKSWTTKIYCQEIK